MWGTNGRAPVEEYDALGKAVTRKLFGGLPSFFFLPFAPFFPLPSLSPATRWLLRFSEGVWGALAAGLRPQTHFWCI